MPTIPFGLMLVAEASGQQPVVKAQRIARRSGYNFELLDYMHYIEAPRWGVIKS